jgi:transposase
MPGFAGIDVSAKKLDVALTSSPGRPEFTVFEQSPDGHRKLARFLKQRRVEAIVMEATGIYYLDAALALDQAGLPVSVINPRAAHYFGKVMLERTKTDRVDAGLLAEYARRMDLQRWQAPAADWLALRDICRRINRLTAMRTAEKNRLHALQAKQHTARILLDDVADQIAQLDRRIDRLAQAALAQIAEDVELQRLLTLLISAKGIAETSALALIGELCLLPRSLRASQVSRHAGMDVRLNESGDSLHKPGRLSKTGNRYLRAALHMPALSLVHHDPHAKAHYQALIGRGKKKLQALCAVQRKLLTGLWACIQNNEPFDSTKLFTVRPENA